ncbi:precorrin-6A synthase (deacetylating) [Cereibacter sphaeroides]|uniref:precorrin-6A synthase (deacetylating) n=1 Tax=Cereibacter sphaeroides TaxID=1063 RepID=UPI000E5AFA30|nr:precorrin-6A synthase (deacetylating) [Cereibacter sphaeroides]RIA00780.1 precorrin-6A synthase (deacetylating) [Cereibacter sphaeroides]
MRELLLIGIGTGNPDHLTAEGRRRMAEADLILVPRKGRDKSDLAEIRRAICADAAPLVPVAEFDLPVRDAANPDYRQGVEDWHDAIALAWARAAGGAARVALLIWGDPSLYDSSLRIAARLDPAPQVRVVPGITAIQALCAAHAIPLNAVGAPVLVTTGRRLRDEGWPAGIDRLAVMLDGETSFRGLDPQGVRIWWGAYLGMDEQILEAGPLAEAGPRILAARAAARARHGWIMDIYLLDRGSDDRRKDGPEGEPGET